LMCITYSLGGINRKVFILNDVFLEIKKSGIF